MAFRVIIQWQQFLFPLAENPPGALSRRGRHFRGRRTTQVHRVRFFMRSPNTSRTTVNNHRVRNRSHPTQGKPDENAKGNARPSLPPRGAQGKASARAAHPPKQANVDSAHSEKRAYGLQLSPVPVATAMNPLPALFSLLSSPGKQGAPSQPVKPAPSPNEKSVLRAESQPDTQVAPTTAESEASDEGAALPSPLPEETKQDIKSHSLDEGTFRYELNNPDNIRASAGDIRFFANNRQFNYSPKTRRITKIPIQLPEKLPQSALDFIRLTGLGEKRFRASLVPSTTYTKHGIQLFWSGQLYDLQLPSGEVTLIKYPYPFELEQAILGASSTASPSTQPILFADKSGELKSISPEELQNLTGARYMGSLQLPEEFKTKFQNAFNDEWVESLKSYDARLQRRSLSRRLGSVDFLDNLTHAERDQAFGEKIEQGYKAPVYIKHINDVVGYGLFANEDIPRGNMIVEYTGTLMKDENPDNQPYATSVSARFPKLSLDAEREGNESRFVNHSYKDDHANAELVTVVHNGLPRNIFVSLGGRDQETGIAKDQQILWDYGYGFWRSRGIYPISL